MATTFKVSAKDALGNTNSTNFKTNLTMAQIKDTTTGKATLLDTFGRALIDLTTDTYTDTTITETASINEILAE